MLGKVETLLPLVHPGSRLRRGLELLRECQSGRWPEVVDQLSNLQPGETRRLPVHGDDLYLLIQCYQPQPQAQGRFEAHARHTDLQLIWSGRECIEVCDLRASQPSAAYDNNGNFYFPMGHDRYQHLLLQAGDVAVLLPEDAHAPCLRVEGEGDELVRKIVVKVMDAHLPAVSPEIRTGAIKWATADNTLATLKQ